MNFLRWMQRIHRLTVRTKCIGCGWSDAAARQASTSGCNPISGPGLSMTPSRQKSITAQFEGHRQVAPALGADDGAPPPCAPRSAWSRIRGATWRWPGSASGAQAPAGRGPPFADPASAIVETIGPRRLIADLSAGKCCNPAGLAPSGCVLEKFANSASAQCMQPNSGGRHHWLD
jgi:hypothetical protein